MLLSCERANAYIYYINWATLVQLKCIATKIVEVWKNHILRWVNEDWTEDTKRILTNRVKSGFGQDPRGGRLRPHSASLSRTKVRLQTVSLERCSTPHPKDTMVQSHAWALLPTAGSTEPLKVCGAGVDPPGRRRSVIHNFWLDWPAEMVRPFLEGLDPTL